MLGALPPDSEIPMGLDGEASRLAKECGLDTYLAAIRHVQALPYGRTSTNSYQLVLVEGRGTCSSKHALLAALAQENGLAVELLLGIYEMTESNTPGVGEQLAKHNLTSIPEAHCYLRTERGIIDVTMPEGSPTGAERHFFHEEAIRPEVVGVYKTTVHRRVLAEWLRQCGQADLGLDAAWTIREACISALINATGSTASTPNDG